MSADSLMPFDRRVELLKRALNDRAINQQSTEDARQEALLALEAARQTIKRFNSAVQRDVNQSFPTDVTSPSPTQLLGSSEVKP